MNMQGIETKPVLGDCSTLACPPCAPSSIPHVVLPSTAGENHEPGWRHVTICFGGYVTEQKPTERQDLRALPAKNDQSWVFGLRLITEGASI